MKRMTSPFSLKRWTSSMPWIWLQLYFFKSSFCTFLSSELVFLVGAFLVRRTVPAPPVRTPLLLNLWIYKNNKLQNKLDSMKNLRSHAWKRASDPRFYVFELKFWIKYFIELGREAGARGGHLRADLFTHVEMRKKVSAVLPENRNKYYKPAWIFIFQSVLNQFKPREHHPNSNAIINNFRTDRKL